MHTPEEHCRVMCYSSGRVAETFNHCCWKQLKINRFYFKAAVIPTVSAFRVFFRFSKLNLSFKQSFIIPIWATFICAVGIR